MPLLDLSINNNDLDAFEWEVSNVLSYGAFDGYDLIDKLVKKAQLQKIPKYSLPKVIYYQEFPKRVRDFVKDYFYSELEQFPDLIAHLGELKVFASQRPLHYTSDIGAEYFDNANIIASYIPLEQLFTKYSKGLVHEIVHSIQFYLHNRGQKVATPQINDSRYYFDNKFYLDDEAEKVASKAEESFDKLSWKVQREQLLIRFVLTFHEMEEEYGTFILLENKLKEDIISEIAGKDMKITQINSDAGEDYVYVFVTVEGSYVGELEELRDAYRGRIHVHDTYILKDSSSSLKFSWSQFPSLIYALQEGNIIWDDGNDKFWVREIDIDNSRVLLEEVFISGNFDGPFWTTEAEMLEHGFYRENPATRFRNLSRQGNSLKFSWQIQPEALPKVGDVARVVADTTKLRKINLDHAILGAEGIISHIFDNVGGVSTWRGYSVDKLIRLDFIDGGEANFPYYSWKEFLEIIPPDTVSSLKFSWKRQIDISPRDAWTEEFSDLFWEQLSTVFNDYVGFDYDDLPEEIRKEFDNTYQKVYERMPQLFIKNKQSSLCFSNLKDKNEQLFNQRYPSYGEDGGNLFWSDKQSQYDRFELLTDIINLKTSNKASILDVGVGFGDYLDFLRDYNIIVGKYVGIDIIPAIIEVAERKHPLEQFEVRDLIRQPYAENSFDYVIGSGLFALDDKDWVKETVDLLKVMYKVSRKAVAVNFLEGASLSDMFKTVSEGEVKKIASLITDKFKIIKGKISDDLTLYLYR